MTVAVVVARGGSRRLPGKALLPFAGLTLVGHKVRTLRACRLIDRVIVGSDSDAILSAACDAGAEVIRRDDFHCDEARCPANEMIADMAGKVEAETIVWAHPTNPMVRSESYDRALVEYLLGQRLGTHDSLASVTVVQRHAWKNEQPDNFAPWSGSHQFASELTPYQFQDGAIFIQPREQMVQNKYFYGKTPLLFSLPAIEGWDIDTREDYDAAVALWDAQNEGRNPLPWPVTVKADSPAKR